MERKVVKQFSPDLIIMLFPVAAKDRESLDVLEGEEVLLQCRWVFHLSLTWQKPLSFHNISRDQFWNGRRVTGASHTIFPSFRFNPVKTDSSLTLYWIRSNRDGSDNAAIESTSLDSNYRWVWSEMTWNDVKWRDGQLALSAPASIFVIIPVWLWLAGRPRSTDFVTDRSVTLNYELYTIQS